MANARDVFGQLAGPSWRNCQIRVPTWTSRLIDELRSGCTLQATMLVNSATANRWFQPLWDFPLCFVRGRIEFQQPTGAPKKKQPTQSSAIAYLGPEIEQFVRTFSEYGRCVVPHESYSVGCAA